MGLGRSLNLRWKRNMAGGGVETDDQTVCSKAQRTSFERKHLIGASIWKRTPCSYRLFF